MKRRISQFGLVALVPAAFNVTAASAMTIAMPICTGDGQVRTVEVPVDGSQGPLGPQGPCCAKGCHGGSSRKKVVKEFEPSQ